LSAASSDITKIKFKSKTVKNAITVIDTKEPEPLQNLLFDSPIPNPGLGTLEVGDILIKKIDDTAEMIIERKTVHDLYNSITSDYSHAHSQVERMYAYQQAKLEQGVYVKVVWLVEGMNDGATGLYHSLPEPKQVDGWVNYLVAISDQYLVTSFNVEHTCSL